MKITTVIIALNEEEHIEGCVDSVRSFSDEIIVIDSGSTDQTRPLAAQAGATVLVQDYLGDGPQRNYGISQSNNDWIFSLDADERVEADTAEFIQGLELENTNIMYAFRRRNFIGNKWLKAAGFYPDYVVRLFNKRTAEFTHTAGHARVQGAMIRTINSHLTHYTYADFADWINRINQMSSRDARFQFSQGKRSTPTGAVARAAFAFFRKLILKRGIFQGTDGWLIAITTSFRVLAKYMKISELSK